MLKSKPESVLEEHQSVFHLLPFTFIHVLDQNTNVTRLEIGPNNFVCKDHERVVYGPHKMITVPARHFCIIDNPVLRSENGEVLKDKLGQVRLLFADQDVRLAQDPFPLYPGEVLKQDVSVLRVVLANAALCLRAVLDFADENGEKRVAGDEWLFEGPGTYIPRKEVEMEETIEATVIYPNHALKLVARKDCIDREGTARVTGEQWMVKKTGAHLPGAYEEIVAIVKAYILTDKKALHLRATGTFTDDFGVMRKNGEEWLIQVTDAESHIPNVFEEVVDVVKITTLTNRQYCVILDPCDAQGHPQLGKKKLVKGEKSFFLMPGEKLEHGIQNVFVLGEDEGLILRATEKFTDGNLEHSPGDQWMIRGPVEYVPPVEVEVLRNQRAIPMDKNEGIYVRNVKTGHVRAIIGHTYMLNQDEVLWEKELPPEIEKHLTSGRDPLGDRGDWNKPISETSHRDKTRVVTFRVPHNVAVQVYDYKKKKARVMFGPEMVILGPEEELTMLSLSGGRPKKSNVIKSLYLMLGPDFCVDIITVETADHARLKMQLSYNWYFDLSNKDDEVEAAKFFSVPDFVGDCCKAMASRVRGAVAGVNFDDFHKNSARIIRASVFGFDEEKKVKETFRFSQNNLVVTNVDVQSVEPVDKNTLDSLQKSVQMAIEITTNSQEATARHEAERLEQEAKGRLERQKISDEAEAEKARKGLLELQAHSAAVESTGQAKAEAQSRAEAARIEGEAAVDQAKLKAQAMKIEAESQLAHMVQAKDAEMKYQRESNEMEIAKSRKLADIEIIKFSSMVDVIGAHTIQAIATSGPEMQVKLLKSLGLESTLITDGSTPINLFNTAQGLVGDIMPVTKRPRNVSQ